MSMLTQINTERRQRLARLSARSPLAPPPRIKPEPKIILIVDGRQWRPPPRPAPALVPAQIPKEVVAFLSAPHIDNDGRPRPKVHEIMRLVAEHYGLTVRQFKERCRKVRITRPRQIAMFLAHERSGLSLPHIGHLMGGYDHTTILHGKRRIKTMMQNDPKVAAAVYALREKLDKYMTDATAPAPQAPMRD